MGVCAIRIDERLIHGQVATLWQGIWNCNRIMVIDEKSANDPILKSVLRIACPSNVKLSVIDADKAAENLKSGKYGNEKITIVTKNPGNIVSLINNGFIPNIEITVGNMSSGNEKKRINKNICVTDEDIKNFKILSDNGLKIVQQLVPSEPASDFMIMLSSVK